MKVYHGSNTKFNELKISKDLLRTTECNLVEGLGIYCLDNKSLKESFQYFYEIEIDECYDFTTKASIKKFFSGYDKEFKKVVGDSIFNIVNDLIEDIQYGDVKISDFKNIRTWILNNEITCNIDDEILEELENKYLNLIPSIYKYKDRNYQGKVIIIKDVEKARIKKVTEK
jgi:hypothetical protein